jgi:hypothetical protein
MSFKANKFLLDFNVFRIRILCVSTKFAVDFKMSISSFYFFLETLKSTQTSNSQQMKKKMTKQTKKCRIQIKISARKKYLRNEINLPFLIKIKSLLLQR